MENNHFATCDQIIAGIIPCCCIMIVHKFFMVCHYKWLLPDQFWFTFCIIFMKILGAIKRIIGKMKRIIGKAFKNKRIE